MAHDDFPIQLFFLPVPGCYGFLCLNLKICGEIARDFFVMGKKFFIGGYGWGKGQPVSEK